MSDAMIELAEQAAIFALAVNHDKTINSSFNGGQAEICSLIAAEAVTFCKAASAEGYWETHDWYDESDAWFDEHIAPVIYEDAS